MARHPPNVGNAGQTNGGLDAASLRVYGGCSLAIPMWASRNFPKVRSAGARSITSESRASSLDALVCRHG